VPNNISNWKVFEGDEHIINFLTNQDNFKDLAIDDKVFQEQSTETDPHTNQPTEKSNFHTILKGITNLENLFDLKEIFKGSKNAKTGSSCPMHETINLGTPKNPKNRKALQDHIQRRKEGLSQTLQRISGCLCVVLLRSENL
jgi:hypothetical protein